MDSRQRLLKASWLVTVYRALAGFWQRGWVYEVAGVVRQAGWATGRSCIDSRQMHSQQAEWATGKPHRYQRQAEVWSNRQNQAVIV